MILTEEQRAALKRVVAYMDEMYAIASPYHGCTEDANILRAMIDSSGTVEPTGGFDLEAARAALEEAIDRMSLAVRDEDGDVWEADPEQAEILQAILDRTEIAENHRCLELQYQLDSAESEIERLRPFEIAARDLDSDLGKIAGERDEQSARIKELEADLEQAERVIEARLEVIDQQSARIKSLKKEIRRLKHESKVEQELTNSYIKHLHEAEARIKELEEAHKRSGAKYAKIINELRSSVYANIPGLDVGKIGPDAHLRPYEVVAADLAGRLAEDRRKSWQITEERKAALAAMSNLSETISCPDCGVWIGFADIGPHMAVLRAMLREAGQ